MRPPALAPRTQPAWGRALVAAALCAVLCAALLAQPVLADTPPMAPGLWEITQSSHTLNGKAMPDPTAQMKAALKGMPPEARKQIEAQMKAQGVQMPASSGAMRICVTAEMISGNRWQGTQGGCTGEPPKREGNTWRWRFTCTQPPGEGEGTTTFSSPQAYTAQMNMRTTQSGKVQTMAISHQAKWVSAACGGVQTHHPTG